MINIYDLRWKLNCFKLEEGLIGGSLMLTPIKPERGSMEASISHKDCNIRFQIDPNIDETWNGDEEIEKYCKASNIRNPVEEVAKKIITHEIWHWKKEEVTNRIGCPTDLLNLGKITDAAYSALSEKGKFEGILSNDKKLKLATGFRNAFEDIVVNTNLGFENLSDGLSIFYYDSVKNNPLNPLTEGFFRMQMELWGREYDKAILEPFYIKDKEKSDLIKKIVKGTMDSMGLERKLNKNVQTFRNPDNWSRLAYNLTYNLSDLLDQPDNQQDEREDKSSQERNKNQQSRGEDQSSPGRNDEDQQDEEENQTQDNEQDKHLVPMIATSCDSEISENIETQLILESYGKETKFPSFITERKSVRLLYQALAKEVEVLAKVNERGFGMPLTPMRNESFDPSEHSPQEIDFTRLRFDADSAFPKGINFDVPEDHYTVFVPYTKKNERMPDIMFLVDSSGTMREDDNSSASRRRILGAGKSWDSNSKYNHALLGVHGAVKWLKKARIAPYIKSNVVIFSNATRTSGWNDYRNLNHSLELLAEPEFEGTYIDMDVLNSQLPTEPIAILFFTDGDIHNWDDIRDQFRNSTQKHLLSYIQIHDETRTGEDLAKWGRPVYHIENGRDLDGLIIDLTKKSYSRHLK